MAIQSNLPFLGVKETEQQIDHRALARPTGPHQSHRFPRTYLERDII